MLFLRTVSTRRLLALLAGLIVAAGGGAAIAVAAVGSGPVPRPKPLAAAIRSALSAHAPAGLSADITFTNGLIGSSDLQGTDPLFSGGSGRLWVTGSHLRLEIQSDNGDAQVVVGPHSFWAYDPASNTVYEGDLGAGPVGAGHRRSGDSARLPSIAQIQRVLNRLAAHAGLSGAVPTDVGGQPAYRVSVSAPASSGGLLGKLALAWDAVRGVPLDFAVYARGNSTPVLELKATSVAYGPVARSVFAMSPPSGARIVKLSMGTSTGAARHSAAAHGHPRLDFTPVAPVSLAGRARQATRTIGWSGHPAELITYGRGLGAVVVIERRAEGRSAALPVSPPSGDGPGLSLPTVSIGGAGAQELPTALGTVLQFTRGGISYLVAGSVPASVAVAAARGL